LGLDVVTTFTESKAITSGAPRGVAARATQVSLFDYRFAVLLTRPFKKPEFSNRDSPIESLRRDLCRGAYDVSSVIERTECDFLYHVQLRSKLFDLRGSIPLDVNNDGLQGDGQDFFFGFQA